MPAHRSVAGEGRLGWSTVRELLLAGVIAAVGVVLAVVLLRLPSPAAPIRSAVAASLALLPLAYLLVPRLVRGALPPGDRAPDPPDSRGGGRSPWTRSPRVRPPVGASGGSIGLGTERPIPAVVALASLPSADAMWAAWEPAVGELSGPLVGPVPETFAPLAPTPAADAFDTGLPALVLPPPGPRDPVGVPLTSSLVPAPWDIGDVAFSDVELEALTPLPPHLRPLGPPPSAPSGSIGGPSDPTRSPARSRCATCRRAIAAVPTWRRCPECHGALCASCAVAAIRAQPRAWCAVCAPLFRAA